MNAVLEGVLNAGAVLAGADPRLQLLVKLAKAGAEQYEAYRIRAGQPEPTSAEEVAVEVEAWLGKRKSVGELLGDVSGQPPGNEAEG